MAKLTRIAPEVPVAELGESLAFYEDKLGFRTVMAMSDRTYAIVERDGIAIHLFEGGGATEASVGLHVFTSQLDELHAEFRARGVQLSQEIMSKPWGNRDFRVVDPSGNVLKFTEPLGEGS